MADDAKTVVLVADDEPSTLAMLASHLRTKGYMVLEASDGDQAWELAHEHLPHLVVLDVMMPGMSGWEVCRKIREAVSLAHTGVLMLTGIGENLNEMTSPLYGADAHIDKPFEFSDLDRKLKETLAKRRAGALGRGDDNDETRLALGWDELAAGKNGKASEELPSVPRPVAKAKPGKTRAGAPAKPSPKKPRKAPAEKLKNGAAAKSKKNARPEKKVPRKKPPKTRPAARKTKKAPTRARKAPVKVPAKTKKAPVKVRAKAKKARAKATKAPAKANKAPAVKANKASTARLKRARARKA